MGRVNNTRRVAAKSPAHLQSIGVRSVISASLPPSKYHRREALSSHISSEGKGSLTPWVRDGKIRGLGSFYVFFLRELRENKAKGQRSRDRMKSLSQLSANLTPRLSTL